MPDFIFFYIYVFLTTEPLATQQTLCRESKHYPFQTDTTPSLKRYVRSPELTSFTALNLS